MRKLKIIQILPTLNTGGVERGVLDFNKYLVNKVMTLTSFQMGEGRLKI